MEILASTLDTGGTLLIAWAAMSVHHKVLNDHRIDRVVYRKMKGEQLLGIVGIIFVITGYVIGLGY